MQDTYSNLCKGQLQADTQSIPSSFNLVPVLSDLTPNMMMWSRPSGRKTLCVDLIDSSLMEVQLDAVFADLQGSSTSSEHEQITGHLGRVATSIEGGPAFLSLLNTSLISEGLSLSSLVNPETPGGKTAAGIFHSAIQCAAHQQRALQMYYRMPWAARNMQEAVSKRSLVAMPSVLPTKNITREALRKTSDLQSILYGMASQPSMRLRA